MLSSIYSEAPYSPPPISEFDSPYEWYQSPTYWWWSDSWWVHSSIPQSIWYDSLSLFRIVSLGLLSISWVRSASLAVARWKMASPWKICLTISSVRLVVLARKRFSCISSIIVEGIQSFSGVSCSRIIIIWFWAHM